MTAAYATILTDLRDGVFTITLNRPEVFNAYNEAMSVELAAALKAAAREDAARCIVLTGAGKAFCSGQDLKEIEARYTDAQTAGPLDFGAHLRRKFNPIVSRLRALEKPVLASVNGAAAGAGASFALACDLRICASRAYFLMAFVHVGLVPDSGATIALVQHAGYAKAAEMCLLGEKLSAEQALACGLANRVVGDEELPAATHEWAARLAGLPPRALALTKRALNHAWTTSFEEQLEYEAFLQQTAGNTRDHREGVLAFVQKRKPRFEGR